MLFHRFRFGLQLPLVLEESLYTSRARFQFTAGVWILRFTVQRFATRPWSARFRHRLRVGEVSCTGLEVCLVGSSGAKDSRSAEARTWRGKGACRGFRSCRVSFRSLTCSCESESESSREISEGIVREKSQSSPGFPLSTGRHAPPTLVQCSSSSLPPKVDTAAAYVWLPLVIGSDLCRRGDKSIIAILWASFDSKIQSGCRRPSWSTSSAVREDERRINPVFAIRVSSNRVHSGLRVEVRNDVITSRTWL